MKPAGCEQVWRQHPASWPRQARAGLGLIVFCLPLLSAWHLYLVPGKRALTHSEQEEAQLKTTYMQKLQQTVTLPALQNRQQWLQQRLTQHEQQFSNSDDLAIVLAEIASAAVHHQLRLEQASPAPVIQSEHYLALPLQLRLSGHYHDIGRFAATLATFPRILILNPLQLNGSDNDDVLSLDTTVLYYGRLATANSP